MALVIVGVVLVAIVLLIRGVIGRPPAHRPAAPVPAPQTRGQVAPFGETVRRDSGSSEPTRFFGLVGTSGVGRLLLNGPRPGWLETATGNFRPITGLPPWQPGYGFTRTADGWAVQRYSPPQADCQVCDAPPAVYFIADRSVRATVVGAAYGAAAAASQGDLWLTAFLPGADIGAASGTIQEVTTAGQGVGPPSQLPSGYVIDRAVKGGLLLAAYALGPGPVMDYLWDPVTGQVVRKFTNVIAASPGQIAWAPCLGTCPLKIVRSPDGGSVNVRLPRGTWAVAGSFSSDQRLLAVQVTADPQPDGSAAATRLEVIDIATGRATVLPGTTVNSLIGISFGWQPDSDRLLAALALPSGFAELASWQPGDTHLSIQTLRLPAGTAPVLGDHG